MKIRLLAIGMFLVGLVCLAQAQFNGCTAGFCSKVATGTAGFTLVASAASVGTNVQTTGAINTTGANLLVVFVSQYNGITIGTLTDSKGNIWTGLTANVGGGGGTYARIYYCASPMVGSGHTFKYDNGTFILGGLAIQAWSGANVSPFDIQNGFSNQPGGGVSVQTGSVTPSQNNSLIVTGLSINDTPDRTGYSINGGYTITANIDDAAGVNLGLAMADFLQTSAAATNPTWSSAAGGSGATEMTAVIAVFKP